MTRSIFTCFSDFGELFFSFLCFCRFIQDSPTLSEFESQIIFYRNLEMQISAEPEYIIVGALALFTGNDIYRNASLTS